MKMLLTMLLAVMAIVSFAVEYNDAEWSALSKTNDIAAKLAYWKSVDANTSDMINKKTLFIALNQVVVDGITDSDKAIALADEIAAENGCINPNYIAFIKMAVLRTIKDYSKAVEIGLANKGKWTNKWIGYCYANLKQYDKAIEAFRAIKDYYHVAYFAGFSENPDVKYNAYKDALLKKKLNVARANDVFIRFVSSLDDVDIDNKELRKVFRRIRRKYKDVIIVDGKKTLKYDALQTQLGSLMIDLQKEIEEDN